MHDSSPTISEKKYIRPLPIIQIGHPTLWQKAKPVQEVESLDLLVVRMVKTLRRAQGVGLAAPQVNHRLRMFVMDIHPTEQRKKLPTLGELVIINPQIIASSEEHDVDWEGCLSIVTKDGLIFGRVSRPRYIEVAYQDMNGKKFTGQFSDFAARVFQHEYDHLEGVLFLQRMKALDSLVNEKTYRHLISQPQSS